MLKNSLFINDFQKGASENANIGTGAIVGCDTYTKKGVALLAKNTTGTDFSSLSASPHFLATTQSGSTLYIWVQLSDGTVYYLSSATSFAVKTATNTAWPGGGNGNGMILFQNYMFAFTDTKIYYWKDTGTASGIDPSGGAWVDWTTAKSLAANLSFGTSPINALHFPFLFPSSRGVYFGNGSASGSVGFFGQNGTTTFDPAGTAGTDFLYNGAIFRLPSITYLIGSLSFLPPSNLAIAAYQYLNNPQNADLITWDTVSANKFNPPLSMYSNSQGYGTAGIKQLFNRNQVLYAVTGGSHTIYETNGSTFNLIEDISLYSNVRSSSGAQTNLPVFFNSYPQAICVLGNKLLTGVSTPPDNTYLTTGLGIFPMGIWSIAFMPDGSKSTQCEYIIPAGSTTSPSLVNNYARITCIIPIGNGQIAFGYAVSIAGVLSSGVGITSITDYPTGSTNIAIESPMFEIGTSLNPQAVNNIEILLVKKLATNQTIDVAYRTGFDQNYTTLASGSFTGDGTKDNYKITKNEIGATRYLQLRIKMATALGIDTVSPELRNVIIS